MCCIICGNYFHLGTLGVGVTGPTCGLVTLHQEPLVVKDTVGRPSTELGVSNSVECDTFSLQCSDTVG